MTRQEFKALAINNSPSFIAVADAAGYDPRRMWALCEDAIQLSTLLVIMDGQEGWPTKAERVQVQVKVARRMLPAMTNRPEFREYFSNALDTAYQMAGADEKLAGLKLLRLIREITERELEWSGRAAAWVVAQALKRTGIISTITSCQAPAQELTSLYGWEEKELVRLENAAQYRIIHEAFSHYFTNDK